MENNKKELTTLAIFSNILGDIIINNGAGVRYDDSVADAFKVALISANMFFDENGNQRSTENILELIHNQSLKDMYENF